MKLAVLLSLFLMIAASSDRDRAREANQAYERGDYAAAEQIYREILSDDPGNTRVLFNLGNTLAKQQKHEESIEAYERFKRMSDNPADRALADYNIGNLHTEKEQWSDAMEQYRKALRQNPADEDSRYNYELAQRMMQEQPPEQEQQQQQQGDGDTNEQEQDQQQQQQDQQQNQQQNQDDSESPDQQQQDQQEGGEGEQQRDEQERPQDMEGQISPQEAERMLNALESKEKDLLKDHLKQQVPPSPPHAKDW